MTNEPKEWRSLTKYWDDRPKCNSLRIRNLQFWCSCWSREGDFRLWDLDERPGVCGSSRRPQRSAKTFSGQAIQTFDRGKQCILKKWISVSIRKLLFHNRFHLLLPAKVLLAENVLFNRISLFKCSTLKNEPL